MSSKFVLIPEAYYQGLLTSNAPRENPNLTFAKEKLESAKNIRRSNKSAKNILYNQELRRYLKIRKDAEDKPVKVELSDGSKMIGRKSDRKRLLVGTNGDDQVVDDSGATSADDDDDTEFSDESNATAKIIEEIIAIIGAEPDRFGVNQRGQILDDNGTAIRNSNLVRSLNRILTPHSKRGTDPPGTSLMRERLRNIPRFRGKIVSRSAFSDNSQQSSSSSDTGEQSTKTPVTSRAKPSQAPRSLNINSRVRRNPPPRGTIQGFYPRAWGNQ